MTILLGLFAATMPGMFEAMTDDFKVDLKSLQAMAVTFGLRYLADRHGELGTGRDGQREADL